MATPALRVFMMVGAAVAVALLTEGCGPSIESSKRFAGDTQSWPHAYVDLVDKGTKGVMHVINGSNVEVYTSPVSIEAKSDGDSVVIKTTDGQYYLDLRKTQPGNMYLCDLGCGAARPFQLPMLWQLVNE